MVMQELKNDWVCLDSKGVILIHQRIDKPAPPIPSDFEATDDPHVCVKRLPPCSLRVMSFVTKPCCGKSLVIKCNLDGGISNREKCINCPNIS